MKNIAALMTILFLAGAISACNTTRGIGEDIEAAGEKVQDVAEDTREELNE